MLTTSKTRAPIPRHVGIIMDGNGRWAEQRGLPRSLGHLNGVKTVKRIVQAALEHDIRVLTLYAFSADNWGRPEAEVSALMGLLKQYLRGETAHSIEQGVRLNFIGRRDRLEPSLVAAIEQSERDSASGERLLLRVAVDYSSREALLRAAAASPAGLIDPEAFSSLIEQACHSVLGAGPVDLVIRTAAEQRLSDFLLWESAYAELYFTDALWPEFSAQDFQLALSDFKHRERRFGKLPLTPVPVLSQSA